MSSATRAPNLKSFGRRQDFFFKTLYINHNTPYNDLYWVYGNLYGGNPGPTYGTRIFKQCLAGFIDHK